MEKLTAKKVNNRLLWIIVGSFTFVTYLSFYNIFHQMIRILLIIPFWFLLMSGVLVAAFMMRLIYRQELAIGELEKELLKGQRLLMELESQLRVVRYDADQMSAIEFKVFSAEFLRLQSYQGVQMLVDNNEVDIQARDQEGGTVYVKCLPVFSEEKVHQLSYQMLRDDVKRGIIFVNGEVPETTSIANIQCLGSADLKQVSRSLLPTLN